MRLNTFKIMLVLLAVMLPTAWAFANGKITIAAMQHGNIVASHSTAEMGETVTLTVKPAENYLLNRSSLVVEQTTDSEEGDHPVLASRRMPYIGGFVGLTQTDTNTFIFEMPDGDVLVSAAFLEQGPIDVDGDKEGDNTITFNVEPDYNNMTAVINQVSQNNSRTPIKVHIPATVTDEAGNVFSVSLVAGYAFYGMPNVTDIYLPETDEPLKIEEGAFLLDGETGDKHHIAVIRTPLQFFDDYALMTELSENYAASKVVAEVTVINRYRTFSCGINVQVPANITVYTAYANGSQVEFNELGAGIIIKANNGVILEGNIDGTYHYEVTAIPSNDRPSGMEPPTDNANSYGKNELIPVVKERHLYSAQNYYILRNSQFYPVMREDVEVKCPPCKAVLHIPRGATGTTE